MPFRYLFFESLLDLLDFWLINFIPFSFYIAVIKCIIEDIIQQISNFIKGFIFR